MKINNFAKREKRAFMVLKEGKVIERGGIN
jgi:hypothetical protein